MRARQDGDCGEPLGAAGKQQGTDLRWPALTAMGIHPAETHVLGCPGDLSERGLALAALLGFEPETRAVFPYMAVAGPTFQAPQGNCRETPASFMGPLLEAVLGMLP